MKDIRIGAVQMEHRDGDKAANLAVIRRFVQQAAEQKLQIVAFPECCITGYWYLRHLDRAQLVALAEPIPEGPSTAELLDLSRQYGLTIGAGLVEIAVDGSLYNSYVVAMPDGTFACHRKLHCFVSEHMSSGDTYTVFDTPHGCRVGILICYDNNIVENVRMTALHGAELLLAPHQTGGCTTPDPHTMGLIDRRLWDERHTNPAAIEAEFYGCKGRGWLMRWLPARAHDSGLFLAFANGVGVDDDEIRTGNAMILDCYGRILTESWRAADLMVTADLDASLLRNATGRRWIRTRRPELYGPLAMPTGDERPTRELRFDNQGV